MSIEVRLKALEHLRKKILERSEYFEAVIHRASVENSWFVKENIYQSLEALARNYLNPEVLSDFVNRYAIDDNIHKKRIGIIMAGNIPVVGFHDWLCCFICGYDMQIKLSEKDLYLLPQIWKEIEDVFPAIGVSTSFVNKLKDFDAVIATGSNNSNRYFEYYFRDYDKLLRKGRVSVAVLDGSESESDFELLGNDIYSYYGLGCRNVSKLFIPKDYDLTPLITKLMDFNSVMSNGKYKNNYDYNFAIWSLNRDIFFTNYNMLFKEDQSQHARIASQYFEYYTDVSSVESRLSQIDDDVQCVATKLDLMHERKVSLGDTQNPSIYDFADGIDTMQFLLGLS